MHLAVSVRALDYCGKVSTGIVSSPVKSLGVVPPPKDMKNYTKLQEIEGTEEKQSCFSTWHSCLTLH